MTTPQSGFNIGKATGYVDIDPSGVRAGLGEAKKQLGVFQQDMARWVTNTGRQIRDFGATWTAMTAPIGLAMGVGLRVTSSFDASLKEIKARADLTEEAMEQVRQKALELGADTAFSTQQAADAFLQLMTAGMSLADIMREDADGATVLDHVLAGAAASGEDLGLTADQVTNIMSSFNLEVTEAARIVDAMSQAAASSPASMGEMGEALQLIGGDAQSFGLSLEQTSAALAIMAQSGKRGSEAANQLKSMFTAMTQPTERAQEAWARAGTSLFDASGNARDFSVVLQELKEGLATMDDQTRAETIQALAGSYGRVGFNALLASDGIDAMIETMNGQASAATVAEERMNTFQGKITSLMGSVETLMITTLTPFMNNILLPIVNQLIDVTNAVTAWASENEVLVQHIMTFAAILVGLGPVLTIVGQAIMFIGGALAFWLSPIGLVIGAVGALAFMFRDRLMPALQRAWGGFTSFRDILGDTNDYVGAFVSSVATAFMQFALSLGAPIQAAISMARIIEGTFFGLRILISTFIDDLRSFGLGEAMLSLFGRGSTLGDSALEGLFLRMGFSRERAIELTNGIFTVFSQWFVQIRSLFLRVRNAVVPMFREIFTFLSSGAGTSFLSTLINIVRTLWSIVSPLANIRRILNFFGINALAVFEDATRVITTFFGMLNRGFPVANALRVALGDPEWLRTLIDGFNTVSEFFTGKLIPAFQALVTFMQGDGISSVATFMATLIQLGINSDIASRIVGIATAVRDDIIPAFQDALNTVIDFTTGLADAFQDSGFEGAATFIQDNLITPIFNAIATIDWMQVATDVWNGITGAFSAVANVDWNSVGLSILDGIGAVLSAYAAYGTWLMNNVYLPLVNAAITFFTTTDWGAVGQSIIDGIGTYLQTVYDFYGWIGQNILQPILDNAKTAIENVNWFSVGEGVVNAIGAALTATFDFVAWIISSLFGPITDNTDTATGQVDWSGVGDSIMNAIGSFLSGVFDFVIWISTNVILPFLAGAATAISNTDWSSIGDGLMDAIANALPNIATWAATFILGPLGTALSGFDLGNALGGGDLLFGASNNSGTGSTSGTRTPMRSFARGINFVPNDMVARIHQGEAVIPAANNPFNRNASDPFGGGFGDINVYIDKLGNVSPFEADDIARMIADKVKLEMRGYRKKGDFLAAFRQLGISE